jgi:hypothetical protein
MAYPPFTLWPPLTAAAISPIAAGTPLLIDQLPDLHAVGTYCLARRLQRNYGGPLFTVRRASDNAVLPISCASGLDTVNEAALTAFCAGTNGFIANVYNQSSWAQAQIDKADLAQVTAAAQPKVYDSVTGILRNAGGKLAAQWDGVDDVLTRATALSFQSTEAFTGICAVDALTTNTGLVWVLGGTGFPARGYLAMERGVSAVTAVLSDQQFANFNLTGSWANSNYYQAQKVGGGNIANTHFWEGAIDKGINGVSPGALTFINQLLQWGGTIGAQAAFTPMKSNTLLFFRGVPLASDQTNFITPAMAQLI